MVMLWAEMVMGRNESPTTPEDDRLDGFPDVLASKIESSEIEPEPV